MKEFKGTPGPWFLGGVENEKQSVNASDYYIALVDDGACRNANARIIAAAPELLSELVKARNVIDKLCRDGSVKSSMLKSADAAISKALGESK